MRVGLIGIGKMGFAILGGLLEVLPTEDVLACDISQERRRLAEELGVRVFSDGRDLVREVDLLVLAVKPKEAPGVLRDLSVLLDDSRAVLSIVAGLGTPKISQLLGNRGRILRMMPNLPLSVREGAMALCVGPRARRDDVEEVKRLFSSLGEVIEIPEELMDAVTGLSGSGPAFFSLFIEAMTEAGVRLGLRREDALRLSAQTALGTAKMILQGKHPSLLREEVTSPAGTTAEGLSVLEAEGVRGAINEAIWASARRARELSDG